MKCIMSKSGKTIDRVKDDVARQKVSTGAWSYTSKESWKKSTRKVEVVDSGIVDETSTESVDVKVHGLKAKDRRKSN